MREKDVSSWTCKMLSKYQKPYQKPYEGKGRHTLIAVAKFATKHGFTESDKLIEKGLLLSHKITEMNKRLKK